jgi:hypothetical protein
MSTFWSNLGVVDGNKSATNQYDLFNGLTFDDGFVCGNQFDFFTHLGTNRYEFFKSYNSVDSNIVDEYTFYQNTNDSEIYDMNSFYRVAGTFISSTPSPTPTVTPTPTATPTPTSTPTPTPTPTAIPGLSEAQRYLAALVFTGGTVGDTVSAATITLYSSLVSNGIYDKINIFYPLVTADNNISAMSIEGKLQTQYNITWNGGWTFTNSGATANGINAYGNLNYGDESTSLNDAHIAIYSFVNADSSGIDIGLNSSSSDSRSGIYMREGTTAGFVIHNKASGYLTSTISDSFGFYVVNRSSSTSRIAYKNGVQIASDSEVSTALAPLNYYIAARNNDGGSPTAYANRGYSFISIGKSLTPEEQSTYYSIIQTFQTSLGRQK